MNNNIFQCETIFWKFLNLYLCFLVFMACGHIHTLYTSPSHHLVGDVCGPQAWVLRSGSLRVLCSILAVTRSVLFWTETSGVLGICVHMWGIQVVLRLLCLVLESWWCFDPLVLFPKLLWSVLMYWLYILPAAVSERSFHVVDRQVITWTATVLYPCRAPSCISPLTLGWLCTCIL